MQKNISDLELGSKMKIYVSPYGRPSYDLLDPIRVNATLIGKNGDNYALGWKYKAIACAYPTPRKTPTYSYINNYSDYDYYYLVGGDLPVIVNDNETSPSLKEKPCKTRTCQKMNNLGATFCWWCQISNPTEA